MLAAQPSAFFLDMLQDAIDAAIAAGTLTKVGLYTNDPDTITVDTVLADLAEPVFTGYARGDITEGVRRSNVNKDIITPYGTQTFQPTADPATAQTVTGYFVEIDGDLWFSEALDEPFTFETTLDGLDILITQMIRNNTVYGGLCTAC